MDDQKDKEKQTGKDEEMSEAAEGTDPEQVFEEAPGVKVDIRVPMLPRKTATKRTRETTSPERESKWQTIEVEAGAKRSPDDSSDEDRSKFQAVADNESPPADGLARHPGPKVERA